MDDFMGSAIVVIVLNIIVITALILFRSTITDFTSSLINDTQSHIETIFDDTENNNSVDI